MGRGLLLQAAPSGSSSGMASRKASGNAAAAAGGAGAVSDPLHASVVIKGKKNGGGGAAQVEAQQAAAGASVTSASGARGARGRPSAAAPSRRPSSSPSPSSAAASSPAPRSSTARASSSKPRSSARRASRVVAAAAAAQPLNVRVTPIRSGASRHIGGKRGRQLRRSTSAPPHKFAAFMPASEALRPSERLRAGSGKQKKRKRKQTHSKRKPKQEEEEEEEDEQEEEAEDVVTGKSNKPARVRQRGPPSKRRKPAADESTGGDAEAPDAPAAVAPKLFGPGRFLAAFDLVELEQRMKQNVEHWTRKNAEALEPALAAAAKAARDKEREEEAAAAEEQSRMQAEQQTEDEAAGAAAPEVRTSHGRVVRRAEPAGKSLAAWGTVAPEAQQRRPKQLHWNSEAYRQRNRAQFHPESIAQAEAAKAARAAAEQAEKAVQEAARYSSSRLDPLDPDRLANEVFQLPASWRVAWTSASYRLVQKLAFMPTSEHGIPRSFELPFDQFGDMMHKYQKRDIVPRYKIIAQNRLRVSRDFFTSAMGMAPRKHGRAAADDDEADSVCTCRYRPPADAPPKGSRQAQAESDASKSFNCGDDCINRLLKIECNDSNCGLVREGRAAECGNRFFSRGAYYPGLTPFKTEFKGWGLHVPTGGPIPAGRFLVEYVGEIINNQMCQERMAEENEKIRQYNEEEMKRRERIRREEEKTKKKMEAAKRREEERTAKNNPNGYYPRVPAREAAKKKDSKDSTTSARAPSKRSPRLVDYSCTDGSPHLDSDAEEDTEYMEGLGPRSANFYFLNLGNDVIIDAGKFGSPARFTNHSCNPNCHIEKWTVDGLVRIGIFSNQVIPPGKELTIDYQYDRVGNGHRQACFCGEPNCARFIGGKKKEIASSSSSDGGAAKGKKKAKEPTKLDEADADEVCCTCGDGGDVIMCDAKVNGRFCTRTYHVECLDNKEVPKGSWICPYHFCDSCGSNRVKYFCHTCAESACEKCWSLRDQPLESAVHESDAASSSDPAPNDPYSCFHATRIRRDLTNHKSNVWTCCSTCQSDAICLSTDMRTVFYDAAHLAMSSAIAARRADPAEAAFGGDLPLETLIAQMYDGTFQPRFVHNYWHFTQNKHGKWDDGYVQPDRRGLPDDEQEEEADQAWLERKQAEARAAEEQAEGEGEDSDQQEEQQVQSALQASEDASAAAVVAVAAAPAPAPAAPVDEAVPMDMDDDDDKPAAAAAPVPRGRKAAAKEGKSTRGARAAAAVSAAAATPVTPAAAPASSSRTRASLSSAASSRTHHAPSPSAAAAMPPLAPLSASRVRKPRTAAVPPAPAPAPEPVLPRNGRRSAIRSADALLATAKAVASALADAGRRTQAAPAAAAAAATGPGRKRKHAVPVQPEPPAVDPPSESDSLPNSSDSDVDTRPHADANTKRPRRTSLRASVPRVSPSEEEELVLHFTKPAPSLTPLERLRKAQEQFSGRMKGGVIEAVFDTFFTGSRKSKA